VIDPLQQDGPATMAGPFWNVTSVPCQPNSSAAALLMPEVAR
jgi:hypothetical protein